MEDVVQLEAQPDRGPYGPIGLLLSLAAMALVAGAALIVPLCLGALVDYLLFGWPHLRDSFVALEALATGASVEETTTAGLIFGAGLYIAGVFGILIVARARAGRAWLRLLAWTPFTVDRTFMALLAAALVYQLGASAAVAYLHPAAKTWFTFPERPLGIASALLLVVILAPLAEELLFRGWIQTALRWRYGFATALWGTAIPFALAHWESSHLYALAILPVGLVLGYLRERTGSARATTLFHMVYNSFGLGLSFLGKL